MLSETTEVITLSVSATVCGGSVTNSKICSYSSGISGFSESIILLSSVEVLADDSLSDLSVLSFSEHLENPNNRPAIKTDEPNKIIKVLIICFLE